MAPKSNTRVCVSAPRAALSSGAGCGAHKSPAMVEITSDDGAGGGYKHDRRVIIYPSYINSRCSVAEGRRIPKDAACDAPNVLEIRDVLEKSMKLPCEVEDKSYPKDFWQRGRVRVTLKKEDGTPIAREFPQGRYTTGTAPTYFLQCH